MSDESAKKEVQVVVGEKLSTAIIQDVRVEVSPNSNVVVYTNNGLQLKPAVASGEAAPAKEGTQIGVGKEFNTVAMYGAKIELAADGGIIVYTNGIVNLKPAPANDCTEPKIGTKMPDGTVFAGISPDTNTSMYVTPVDASLAMTFNAAQKYAAKLDAHGHKDWRVPTKAELNVLFNNRAAIGGFDLNAYPAAWYWSASDYGWTAWEQRFNDGPQYNGTKDHRSAVRCVR